MKKLLYRALASTDTTIEDLGFFNEFPTIEDIDAHEYRGHDIIVDTYLLELTTEQILEMSGWTNEDLEHTSLEEMFNDIDTYEFEEFISYEDIEPAESDVIASITRVNEESDKLIDLVKSELAKKLGRRFFRKYDQVNGKTIRIADHTHNPRNGKCDLNVIIAEQDATRNRFFTAREDLVYDENSDVETIVNDILIELN